MKNLHNITTKHWTNVQKSYQVYWGINAFGGNGFVRFKKDDPDFYSHQIEGGKWYDESFGEITRDYVLKEWAKRGNPEPDYTKMSWYE